jgi:hypothetical protein
LLRSTRTARSVATVSGAATSARNVHTSQV